MDNPNASTSYKEKCELYEKLLGIGEYDPVKNAFLVYLKMMNQQIDYLNDFKLKSVITSIDKDAPEYKRAMEMVDSLPKMIIAVNDLRATLKISKNDLVDITGSKELFDKITTPESMSGKINK